MSKPSNDLPPQCRWLRSKGMYITGLANPSAQGGITGDGNVWCGRTQKVLGPDDQFVSRDDCAASRACFEPLESPPRTSSPAT